MVRKNTRRVAAVGIVAALGLTTAACSGSSSPQAAPKYASGGQAAITADTVTAVANLTGRGTTVTLDSATLAALTSLGVKPTPFGTAALSGADITFPITGGYAEIHSDHAFKPGFVVGSIEHDGSGLTLTKGSTVVTAKNFVVDPGNSMLYATIGSKVGIPLAVLDGTNLQITQPDGTVHLDGTNVLLSQTAAGALNHAFGTAALKAGISLGIAHIVATGTPNTYKDKTTEISRLTGASTSVDLDPATLSALTSLGVKAAPVGTATLSGALVSFPITGGFAAIHSDKSYQPGYIAGSVIHQGSGLTFTRGSTVVKVTDFVVNPGNSRLYATVGSTESFPLFVLDGSAVQVSSSGGAVHLDGTKVELTAEAASALNKAFNTTALTPNTVVGIAHIVAVGA